jgi:hypothetical protein
LTRISLTPDIGAYQIGEIADIEPLHVAAYIEALGKEASVPEGFALGQRPRLSLGQK